MKNMVLPLKKQQQCLPILMAWIGKTLSTPLLKGDKSDLGSLLQEEFLS